MDARDVKKHWLDEEKTEWLNKNLDAKLLELYALYNISKVLHMTFAVDEIFNGTMDIIGKTLQIDEFCIMLIDEKSDELVVRAWYPAPVTLPDIRFKIGEGISGMVAKTGKLALIQDVSKEHKFTFYKGAKTDIGAFLCIPLIGRQGGILGVFNVHKTKPNSFTDNDERFFSEVAQHVALAVDKAITYEKTKEASLRDPLTGLYNRRYFFEYLETEASRANRYDKKFSLLMVDVDHFKNFNDKNGHLKGDEALKKMARLLIKELRCSDVVARYGGEEFICLLPETHKDAAIIAAQKLKKSVEDSKFDGGESQPGGKLTVTVGVATWSDDGKFVSELVDYADRALYLGKSRGRNMVCSKVEI